jgi:Protein of unknown function (DUF3037)
MSDVVKYSFAAAVVQYQHDAALGERLNVGVVLVCHDQHFAQARFQDHLARVSAAFPGASLPNIKATCKAIASTIRSMHKQPGLFDGRAPVDLVNQAIPAADAAFMTSELFRGVTADPARMLDDLFRLYVDTQHREGMRHRDEQEIMSSLFRKLRQRQVPKSYFVKKSVGPEEYQIPFKHVWKNGHMHALQPISFDLSTGDTIREKAASWNGRLHAATPWNYDVTPHIILARPSSDAPKVIRKAADDGHKLLRDQFRSEMAKGKLRILDEGDADSVVEQIAADYREHHG